MVSYAWSSSDYQMAPVMLNQETFTENVAYYSCANNKKGKTTSKKVVIVLLIVSLILISGVGAWFFVNMEEQPVLESDVDLANHEDTYPVDFENIQKTVENTTEVYGSNTQNEKDRDSSMEQAPENVNEIEADDSVPVFYNEGESSVYTGYIMEGGTRQFVWFNDAERVFAGTAREKELGLMVDCDYEIYDPNPDFVAYNFSSACQYSLLRWNSDGTAYDENVDPNVFFNNVDEWTFVEVEMMDGKVIRVSELYSPQ